jgi:phenylacetate-coenzyme A ligase PaaK-like adenylate-forming protein
MITKADIRRGFPHNFLSPEHNLEELMESQLLELEHTSGTSEERTPLLLPYGWWEWQEAGALRLNRMVSAALAECSPARRVVLAPPTCNSTISYLQVPTRAQRTVGEALHLALSKQPFLWSDADLDRMVAEATEWRPVFLDLNPTFGVCFARHCERRGIRFPELRFILSSYEYLSVVHRRILERVFGVPVCNLYGATETGHLLMEDDPGELILVEVTVTTVIAVCGECWLGLFVGGFRESPSWAMFFSVRRHTFSG